MMMMMILISVWVINGTGEPVRRLQHASHSAIDQDRIRPVADTLDTLLCAFFSALTLLDGQQKGRLACKVGSNYYERFSFADDGTETV